MKEFTTTTMTTDNNRLRFVENAFQGIASGGGGGGGGSVDGGMKAPNDEEDVFDRRVYKQMHLGGHVQLEPMTLVEEENPYLKTTILATNNIDYRNRLRVFYLSIITLILFILIATFCLLYRVRFSFFTFLVLIASPSTIVFSAILKRFEII